MGQVSRTCRHRALTLHQGGRETSSRAQSFNRASNLSTQWKVDVRRKLRFPEHITKTSLRPELLLTCDFTNKVVLLELTVPREDWMGVAYEHKKARYLELEEACRENDWRGHCEPFEVGCRGYLGRSLNQKHRCGTDHPRLDHPGAPPWPWVHRWQCVWAAPSRCMLHDAQTLYTVGNIWVGISCVRTIVPAVTVCLHGAETPSNKYSTS